MAEKKKPAPKPPTTAFERVQLARHQDRPHTLDFIERLFEDCELGAIPPVGKPYGMEMIVDDSLNEQPDVYFEAGDHTSLIHVNAMAFHRLMAEARHGRFSRHD